MLKTLLLRAKISSLQKELEALRAKDADFEKRSSELEAAISELSEKEGATDEERTAVEEAVEAFEAERDAHEAAASEMEEKIDRLNAELEEAEAEQVPPVVEPAPAPIETERKDNHKMNTRAFFGMNMQERDAFMARETVKSFLQRVRELAHTQRSVTGAELLIPTEILELLREEAARESKLIPYVNYRRVSGTARQPVMGSIPEAIWTEACATLNELTIVFNAVDTDGYKVGGFVPICNAALQDSDINLAAEIISGLGVAIGKGVDMAILFGTGTKMPLGITTRLAQTSQPATWGANAPAWTDLHTSNVLSLNIDGSNGIAFFEALIAALAVAKPVYSSTGLFWVMNRKTHMKILAKALNFNAAGALVAGIDTMPVIGGAVIEMEDSRISDNCIIGGFGGNYLLAERDGGIFARSDERFFIEDLTVFKGTARFDGMPVAGEAFVSVNFANGSAQTAHDFPEDYANTGMNILTVTAAAGSAVGKTVLTVSNTVAESSPTLAYKVSGDVSGLQVGDKASGFTSLTSGTTAITAAAGTPIGVVELDSDNRVVSVGSALSVPKSS